MNETNDNHSPTFGFILCIILDLDFRKTIRPMILSSRHNKIYIDSLLVLKIGLVSLKISHILIISKPLKNGFPPVICSFIS